MIDVGSGAGFPGIILACARPDLDSSCIESRRRRVSFLCEAIRTVPLPHARALEERAEDASRRPELAGSATMVVSRALRLDVLLAAAPPLLGAGGLVVAMHTPGGVAEARRAATVGGYIVHDQREYRADGRPPTAADLPLAPLAVCSRPGLC